MQAVISLFFIAVPLLAETVVIHTNRGRIRGYVSYDAGPGNPVHVFKGIPFAQAPIGELRFQPPEDPLSWGGVLDATEYSPACMSNSSRTSSPQKWISEDCLYVNVFADKRCFDRRSKPCPVMPYFHGGTFSFGSAVMFNDSQIIRKYASHEIVFVIPAFRLGIFGFLDLGNDDTVRRNVGLYDVIHALKWVKEEIHNFGGNPDDVTVFGSSSGASVTAYLTMSPVVPEEYFHKTISLSNTPNLLKNNNMDMTNLVALHIGCKKGTKSEIVECLRKKSASELISWQRILEVDGVHMFFGPEPDSFLLPGNYFELIKKSTARPVFLGQTQHELFNDNNTPNYEKIYCRSYCEFFEYFEAETVDECVRFYTNETGKYLGKYALEAEAIHTINYRDALLWTSADVPVYLTSFNMKHYRKHSDDMLFALGLHYKEFLTDEERFMDRYYPEVLVNFVKRGSPGEDWSPMSKDGSEYYVIDVVSDGKNSVKPHPVNSYFYPEQVQFWLNHLASVESRSDTTVTPSTESTHGNTSTVGETSPKTTSESASAVRRLNPQPQVLAIDQRGTTIDVERETTLKSSTEPADRRTTTHLTSLNEREATPKMSPESASPDRHPTPQLAAIGERGTTPGDDRSNTPEEERDETLKSSAESTDSPTPPLATGERESGVKDGRETSKESADSRPTPRLATRGDRESRLTNDSKSKPEDEKESKLKTSTESVDAQSLSTPSLMKLLESPTKLLELPAVEALTVKASSFDTTALLTGMGAFSAVAAGAGVIAYKQKKKPKSDYVPLTGKLDYGSTWTMNYDDGRTAYGKA